jgi:hypothetical protein
MFCTSQRREIISDGVVCRRTAPALMGQKAWQTPSAPSTRGQPGGTQQGVALSTTPWTSFRYLAVSTFRYDACTTRPLHIPSKHQTYEPHQATFNTSYNAIPNKTGNDSMSGNLNVLSNFQGGIKQFICWKLSGREYLGGRTVWTSGELHISG